MFETAERFSAVEHQLPTVLQVPPLDVIYRLAIIHTNQRNALQPTKKWAQNICSFKFLTCDLGILFSPLKLLDCKA